MRASDIKPITYMKTHSAELVAAVNEKQSPVVITQNGEPRAVVMDVASYERMQETLALLKLIAQSEEARRKKRWLTQEQMEAEMHKRFGI
jgi:prevent-host-death family protein